MGSIRVSRVSEQLKKELGDIIQKELKDPRVGFVTITKVKMSIDLRVAKVYLSILNESKENDSLKVLEEAKGYLRSSIGKRIKLRCVPELVFLIDDSLDYSEHISDLLKEAKIKDRSNE